ncbi:hypothetical protein HMPREF2772_00375 [Achromobacter xylosoxidans]|uniref:hypothetical protein n=1 Tax=Alcaligenes xylosoxydans xylosoxydans TaxID=85698 RepID=UPI0008A31BFE|nr:hypothetical protein [Achromobacter xylosoxidans]OFL45869.1 hypothetical protein HMPREF2772_00375 [Achromobacter xylosoxidans]
MNPLDKKLQFSMRYADCVRHDGLFKTRCRWAATFAYFTIAQLALLMVLSSLVAGLGARNGVNFSYSLEVAAAFLYYLRLPLDAIWMGWVSIALLVGVWSASSAISLRWLALPDSAKTCIS